MPSPIPESFLTTFRNMARQGEIFDNPVSQDGWYYAFLSKLDPHYPVDNGTGPSDGRLIVTFEIAPRAYIENTVLRSNNVRTYPRNIPASLLQFENVDASQLRQMLGFAADDLKTPLAEGEWYLVKLEKPPAEGIDAVMVDPKVD